MDVKHSKFECWILQHTLTTDKVSLRGDKCDNVCNKIWVNTVRVKRNASVCVGIVANKKCQPPLAMISDSIEVLVS